MQKISDAIGKIMGRDDEKRTEDAKKRVAVAEDKLRKAPRDKVRALVTSAVALSALALPGCASFPRLRLELGAFGFTAALDTRAMTDELGDVAVSIKDLVLPQPPAADAAGPVTAKPTTGEPK